MVRIAVLPVLDLVGTMFGRVGGNTCPVNRSEHDWAGILCFPHFTPKALLRTVGDRCDAAELRPQGRREGGATFRSHEWREGESHCCVRVRVRKKRRLKPFR